VKRAVPRIALELRANRVFTDKNDEFHASIAENLEQACKLLEVGFEYVTDIDGKRLFRKRK
jgi:hypothetical protein